MTAKPSLSPCQPTALHRFRIAVSALALSAVSASTGLALAVPAASTSTPTTRRHRSGASVSDITGDAVGLAAGRCPTLTGVANVATRLPRRCSSNTTGALNVATGRQALLSNTTGDDNVATGSGALASNTTGNDNVATGRSALFSNTTGERQRRHRDRRAVLQHDRQPERRHRLRALASNTTGNNNVAIGATPCAMPPGRTTSPSARTPVRT